MKQYKNGTGVDKSMILLVVLAFLCNIAGIVFGYLNSSNALGLFHNSIQNLSTKYYNEVAPVGIAFVIIWPIIYLWTLAGSFYLVVSLCLSPNESPVKTTPTLTPKVYLMCYSLAFASSVAWFFTFDREKLMASFGVLLLSALLVYIAVAISLVLVYMNLVKLELKSNVMLWVVRILLQNGLCLFGTWLTLATSIGFTISLVYVDSYGQDHAVMRGLVSMQNGSSITLVILFSIMIAWFVLENFVLEKYLRYMFSIYPVFIFAFASLIAKLQPVGATQNLILASINLGVAAILLIARITLSVFKLSGSVVNTPYQSFNGEEKLIKN